MSSTSDPEPFLRLHCTECDEYVPRSDARRQYNRYWHIGCGHEITTPNLGDL